MRPQIVRLFLQPVAVLVDDLAPAAEAVIERAPGAFRLRIELAHQGITVTRLRRVVEFGEQFVIAVHRPRRIAFGQPGGEPEIRPVLPAVIDDVTADAGFVTEPEQRDFGTGVGDDAAEFGEEVGGGEHDGGP
ncbi:MAG TPA: hypothetical protein VM165_19665 [Planctomycetaceae bacterium]|nr:hypothetical protein [Planctomycetaceae bacterium]